ncbi:MAG: hypothetical protein MJZ81_09670 [Bacteroidales bacterium]|nr:hypothetical protein [Bacteroidales bacterium]
MLSLESRTAISAIVKMDREANAVEKKRILEFVEGCEKPLPSYSGANVLTFLEASRRLGCRNAQFARNLVKAGKLEGVVGLTGNRPVGVSSASVEEYIAKGGRVRSHATRPSRHGNGKRDAR